MFRVLFVTPWTSLHGVTKNAINGMEWWTRSNTPLNRKSDQLTHPLYLSQTQCKGPAELIVGAGSHRPRLKEEYY